MLPLDASEMGWDRSSLSSSSATIRRVRSRLDGKGEGAAGGNDAEATDSTGEQLQQGGAAHDGQKGEEAGDDVEEEEEESAEERKFRWQKEARKALREAQKVRFRVVSHRFPWSLSSCFQASPLILRVCFR